ncbi:serine carboxypeptidase-domain-containing protein, partial [Sporodiniella umbellata]
ESYKINTLPGIDTKSLNFSQYSGYIDLQRNTSTSLFFWMLEQENKKVAEKLIIWFNGGPGCSSMNGLFLENGPYRVNKNLTLRINPAGWQKHATVVYLDQPIGTGFSFLGPEGTKGYLTEATQDFIDFLDEFFRVFPRLKHQPLYLAGESYAGVYIPHFATRILSLNKAKEKKYNLKGAIIGNGWISPIHHYDGIYDFSIQNNLIAENGLSVFRNDWKKCREIIKKEMMMTDTERIMPIECNSIVSDIHINSIRENENGDKLCVNIYDVRLRNETYPACGISWPHELNETTQYLQLPELKKSIHIDEKVDNWKECNSKVKEAFHSHPELPSYHLLPAMLEEIQLLIFSGNQDIIANTLGAEYFIGNMTWGGYKGFRKRASKKEWIVKNRSAGYYSQDRNLTFVVISGASHMAPYDKPFETLDMINRFLGSKKDSATALSDRNNSDLFEGLLDASLISMIKKPIDAIEKMNTKQNSEKETKEWIVVLVIILVTVLISAYVWFNQIRRPSYGEVPRYAHKNTEREIILNSTTNQSTDRLSIEPNEW